VRWPTPFFFATFFFGVIEKKKVARLDQFQLKNELEDFLVFIFPG